MKCRICGNEKGNKGYQIKEMMFGFGEEFIYFQCANCGCLQIKEMPDDISKYYPSNYYSFGEANNIKEIFHLIQRILTALIL